ncbi:MAG: von Willebrand factor type [Frankiales bacterium]|nr:von Willebrand factor type [Frankiales bacterium]
MTFLAAWRLWLLLLLVPLVVLYGWAVRRPSRFTVALPGLDLLADALPARRAWRRHVPAGLLLLTLALLTVGFARPEGTVKVPRERATVMIALDTSLSMQATDVEPDRDAAARQSAVRFVAGLPPRFNVGLVSFSGGASIVVPPTQDHAEVEAAVGDLSLGSGTAIGEAVFSCLDALRLLPAAGDLAPPPARIVLLSDGTNTVGREVSAAVDAARAAGVPVSTIAFGTPDGVVEVEGQVIPVAVDREALAQLASDTGGNSYTAQSRDALSAVYDDIGSQVGTTEEKREVASRFAGIGLLTALAAAGTALAWGVRFP